jgi:hypothetical protein
LQIEDVDITDGGGEIIRAEVTTALGPILNESTLKVYNCHFENINRQTGATAGVIFVSVPHDFSDGTKGYFGVIDFQNSTFVSIHGGGSGVGGAISVDISLSITANLNYDYHFYSL